ncbi:hypothetical protein KPH14_006268 [Odynerus spinipes]|uniref:Uncharacterized protein n=1 Tax=Odynerus spinipes TaxID=1348599 RepID=A0AAD9RDN2_9HYME|nr:hypothetical protein KPH14_006268 [Odynerus spinipes]
MTTSTVTKLEAMDTPQSSASNEEIIIFSEIKKDLATLNTFVAQRDFVDFSQGPNSTARAPEPKRSDNWEIRTMQLKWALE